MDTSAYIASGILEQYAFGLLPADEAAVVMANIAQYPALAEELLRIEQNLELYLSLGKTPPSPGFYPALEERLADVVPDAAPGGPGSPPTTGSSAPWWLGGLLLLAVAGTLLLWRSKQQQAQQIEGLQSELSLLAENCKEDQNERDVLRSQLQILRSPGNRFIQMNGTEKAPAAIASVIYNTDSELAYLDIATLPTPPTNKQYQLWAIVDGTPVDMGVFDLPLAATDDLQAVPFIANAQAFAVTLEPTGGSVSPTLEEMVVVGNVG